MVYYGAHPNAALEQTTSLCDATLVSAAGPAIDKLVAENPYLSTQTIPGGTYASVSERVVSFGTTVTVVTSVDTDDGIVRDFVRSVMNNLPTLARIHPAFKSLDAGAMARRGLTAPLHDGALRYYSEAGIM